MYHSRSRRNSSEPLAIENGDLFVPNGPPWIEIDESVIQKCRSFRSLVLFQNHLPAETVAVTGDHSVKWITAQ